MDYKVIWTDESIEDLRELTARIAANNPSAALRFGQKIIRQSMLLSQHPRFGRVLRQQDRETLREMVIKPYRLIYEIDDDAATVKIRVLWHGARQEPESQPGV